MKHFSAFLRIFSAFGVFAFAASAPAQEQGEVEGLVSPAASFAAINRQNVGESAEARPTMPRLFFTNEQRRILEVVRQEFITEENLEFAEFAPLLIEQQETLDVEEEQLGRAYDLSVHAFIRNRSSGEGRVWINNEAYPLQDESGVLQREGLDGLTLESGGEFAGTDVINNSRFVVKVGQKLAGDGEVNETYPVIIVKKQ